jgi:hypothetical protein
VWCRICVLKSAKQATVVFSRSTADAEDVAAGEIAKEVEYLHPLAQELRRLAAFLSVLTMQKLIF